jgi:hypothetical protein
MAVGKLYGRVTMIIDKLRNRKCCIFQMQPVNASESAIYYTIYYEHTSN